MIRKHGLNLSMIDLRVLANCPKQWPLDGLIRKHIFGSLSRQIVAFEASDIAVPSEEGKNTHAQHQLANLARPYARPFNYDLCRRSSAFNCFFIIHSMTFSRLKPSFGLAVNGM